MEPNYLASHIIGDEAIDLFEMLVTYTAASLEHSRSFAFSTDACST